MSSVVMPRASPKRMDVTSVAKDPDLDTMRTPNASIPTNKSPIAVSSRTGVRLETKVTRPLIMRAERKAPTTGLKPHKIATAIPGMTPWAKASPRNASPRKTIHVPTREVATTAITPPTSARCMNAG